MTWYYYEYDAEKNSIFILDESDPTFGMSLNLSQGTVKKFNEWYEDSLKYAYEAGLGRELVGDDQTHFWSHNSEGDSIIITLEVKRVETTLVRIILSEFTPEELGFNIATAFNHAYGLGRKKATRNMPLSEVLLPSWG